MFGEVIEFGVIFSCKTEEPIVKSSSSVTVRVWHVIGESQDISEDELLISSRSEERRRDFSSQYSAKVNGDEPEAYSTPTHVKEVGGITGGDNKKCIQRGKIVTDGRRRTVAVGRSLHVQ